MGIIYKIENKQNGKVYIGQTKGSLKERLNNNFHGHFKRAFVENKNHPLYDAMRKYGKSGFTYEIIEEVSNDLLDEREIYWIEFYNSHNILKGYNLTDGGKGISGTKWSREARRKQSIRMKQKMNTPQVKKKLSEGVRRANAARSEEAQKMAKSHRIEGLKHSWSKKTPQEKEKFRESIRKSKSSITERKRMSERMKAVWANPEFKQKMKEKKQALVGSKLLYKDGKGKRIPKDKVQQAIQDGWLCYKDYIKNGGIIIR